MLFDIFSVVHHFRFNVLVIFRSDLSGRANMHFGDCDCERNQNFFSTE